MIELRTLGALELTSTDGTSVGSVLAQPRRAALLCYLALASPRGFHRRDTLFALFWPEHDAAQARHALRQAVYFLRGALGPKAIVSRGDEEVALGADQVRSDVRDFEAAPAEGRAADALVLYRGELLPGFHVANAPDFERWLDAERARLREGAEEAAWSLASARLKAGDAVGAVEAARRAVALAPTDETAFRRLLLLLECAGDRAAAVRAYEAFARRLREEYDLEPSAETQAVVARIRAGAAECGGAVLGPAPERVSVAPPARGRRARAIVAGAVIVALLATLAAVRIGTESRRRADSADALAAGAPAPAIAVLPFALQDEALANWREGIMDLVSMDLSDIPGLRAVDGRTVLARWREVAAGGDAPALATALEVAERAGGRYAVAGSVIADGPDLILTAGVHELPGRRMLGTARARGPADSIFGVVDRLTLEILRLMPGGDARELARIDLARVNTASLPALKAFLEGEVQFRRSRFESAAKAYGKAVEADSTFALARYRLGFSRQWFWTDMMGTTPDPLAPAVGEFAGRLPAHEAAMFRAFQLRDQDVSAARDLLEEEARRHPEDADAWYQLGEFYHHSGEKVPVSPGAAGRALDRAIALDSNYSLPYIHRIEYAVRDGDRAGADRLLRTFALLAPDAHRLANLRLLAGLVVGDATARPRSEAALDTLAINDLFALGILLAQIHHWDLSERAFQTAWDRGELRRDAAMPLFFTSLGQGKIRQAYRWVTDPVAPRSHKARMLHALAELGAPIPPAELEAVLRRGAADDADPVELFYLGSLAAKEARWEVVESTLVRLGSRARSLDAAGDSSAGRFADALREGLEGYVSWRRGQRDRALPLLQGSQRRALRGWSVNNLLRWWLGRLLVEMGRPREALPYFESLTGDWLPADYERGRLSEEAGMTDQAREAYTRFLGAGPEADLVFQPMIQESRAGLERLGQARSDPSPSTPRH